MVQEEEIRAPVGGPTGVAGATLNRSLSGQRLQQYQQAPGISMAGRPPTAGVATPHYNPQFMTNNAAASSPGTTPMMMAQRPGQMQQQQQRPSAAAQASQIRAGNYLQQAQQYPPNQFVHHITSVPMNTINAARPGVQGSIAPATGTQHYGNMQNLTVAQQHNMQAGQKPNQGQTPGTQYIGGVTAGQQRALGVASDRRLAHSVSIASQQQQQQQQQQALQQQQQQQALQQQQINAQRLGPQQQQVMARQNQAQQMLQNQGNTMLARGSATGAQMQGVPSGGQQQQVWQGKPAQYQQQPQQQQQQQQQQPQQQARPQMVTTALATSQARPGTPGAAAQAINALPPAAAATAANTEPLDATGSILGKRSIQDLLAQIDPRERLDPDVEEVFLEIADDFIENVATFSCKIAQHRKSKMLEAKDVLLHLDKAYNITVPGFGGEEYRSFKRPSISETHKQRLAVVRKSAAAGLAAAESKASNLLAAAPATNASTPVKSGLSTGTGASPTPSTGMPRIPRV